MGLVLKCPSCKKTVISKYLGATIGAAKLYACPKCGTVLCPDAVEK